MFYNAVADTYDTLYTSALHKAEDEFVRSLLRAYVREAQSVLDVGCGTAPLFKSLREYNRTARLVGVDVAPEMIRIASKRYHTCHDMEFYAQSAEALEVEQTFDAVISLYGSLNYCSPRALHEIDRVLKPNGTLLIIAYDKEYALRPSYAANRITTEERPSMSMSAPFIAESLSYMGYDYIDYRGMTPKHLEHSAEYEEKLFEQIQSAYTKHVRPSACWWHVIIATKERVCQ